MNCRSCNTPVPSRSSSCPNCGRNTSGGESFIDEPGNDEIDMGSVAPPTLGPSSALDESLEDSASQALTEEASEAELSLDDAVVPAAKKTRAASADTPPSAARHGKKRSAGTKRGRKAARAAEKRPVPAAKQAMKEVVDGGSVSSPAELDLVRAILGEHPELLEPGLELLVDDAGQEIGLQHATEVGVIDLLARDAEGRLVAVIVANPDARSDLVAEALHRVGWVRKHLAKNGEEVRGIVLTDHLDEQLVYAAAAVSSTICFKSYALSLALTDLDV